MAALGWPRGLLYTVAAENGAATTSETKTALVTARHDEHCAPSFARILLLLGSLSGLRMASHFALVSPWQLGCLCTFFSGPTPDSPWLWGLPSDLLGPPQCLGMLGDGQWPVSTPWGAGNRPGGHGWACPPPPPYSNLYLRFHRPGIPLEMHRESTRA
jgi:hypothetical protein